MTRKRIPDPEPEPGTVELTIPNYGLIARLRRRLADKYMTHTGLTGSDAMHEAAKTVAIDYITPPISGPQLASWLAANAAAYGYFRRKRTDRAAVVSPTPGDPPAQPALLTDHASRITQPASRITPPKPLLGQPSHVTTADQLVRNAIALAPGHICVLPPIEMLAHLLGVDHHRATAIVRGLDADGYHVETITLEADGSLGIWGDGACIGYHVTPTQDPQIAALERQIALLHDTIAALDSQVGALRGTR